MTLEEKALHHAVRNPGRSTIELMAGFAVKHSTDKIVEALYRHGVCKWISVKDKLPETEFGTDPKYSSVVAVLCGEEKFPVTAELQRFEDGWLNWYDPLTDTGDIQVTHWLPLPERPKED